MTCSWIDWCVFSLLNAQNTLYVSILLSLRAYQGCWQESFLLFAEGFTGGSTLSRLIQAFLLSSFIISCLTIQELPNHSPPILCPIQSTPVPINSRFFWILFPPEQVNPLHKNLQQLVTAWLITLPLRIQLILMVIHFWKFCYVLIALADTKHAVVFSKIALLWKVKFSNIWKGENNTGPLLSLILKFKKFLKSRSLSYTFDAKTHLVAKTWPK